ncbi:MAG: DUF1501 domain-containing protein [Pirellulales bacterium]|nr:DUF1501 domain-containing protein [Pirellulales bacterium]
MRHLLHRRANVSLKQGQVLGRRDFLRGVSLAGLAAGTLSWTDLMAVHARELRSRNKACILLWMQGGPSPFETFNPLPDHENGGETKAIDTAVPGIQIADNFPHVAQVMDDVALVRSMTTKEGNHQRASFLLHTGYAPTASVKHPTLGSIASRELGDDACDLPAFVRIGKQFRNTGGGGLLGSEYDPFVMATAAQLPSNTKLTTDEARFQRRLGLLERLEGDHVTREVSDHRKLYEQTARMVTSRDMRAFDLAEEPDKVREAYGEGDFAAGCLMARRLIESGVTFVEVSAGSWDTHDDNFNRVRKLAGEVDQPFAQLVRDLKQRSLLDDVLVVWMGEFGRTPKINPRGGRDHYPKAFNVALAGGGIRGGQVIGKTDPSGAEVADRPVTVQDLLQTVCQSLKIDAAKENMSSIGRPIKVVDGGAPISELFA